jgi:hypothetical protein
MKKILLGGASALAVAVIAFSGPANAACSWNGYNWDCASPQAYYQPYTNSTVTSRITDMPSPSPRPTITGSIRNGIPRVIRVRRPVPAAGIRSSL